MGGEDRVGAVVAAEKMLEALRDSGSPATASLVTDPGAQAVLWRCRTDAAGLATRRADGAEAWGGWEDAAVPPELLADYLRGLDGLMGRHGLAGAYYGHFGEGCMHMRIDFDLMSSAGLTVYRTFVEEATDLVVSLGGSVSGEHGDGRARSELLGRMYGTDGLALLSEMKDIWDPDRVMNPGVIVDPPAFDAAIRHQGAAFIDVISPCVAFNNHAGSTKSFDYVREHNDAVNRLDVITGRDPITVDYAPGSVQIVEQHDGTRLPLRKLDADYEAHDRLAAMAFLQKHAARGQVVTGLLYVDPDAEDLHAHLDTVDTPLNQLDEKALCPGSAALDKFNASLR